MHAAILGGLARQPVTERVLWRLDAGRAQQVSVLILTQSRPAWGHLIEQGGWPGADHGEAVIRSYDRLIERVLPDAQFAFVLRANTVAATKRPLRPSSAQARRLNEDGRVRGARVPQRTVAHQLTWLLARVGKWGFEIPVSSAGQPAVRVVARDRTVFFRGNSDGPRNRVVLQTATFEGRLKVVDETQAKRSLLQGVGKARAYGCGLITLAADTGPRWPAALTQLACE